MDTELLEKLFEAENELFALAEKSTNNVERAKYIGKADGIAYTISVILNEMR